jgi:hypothetical protein
MDAGLDIVFFPVSSFRRKGFSTGERCIARIDEESDSLRIPFRKDLMSSSFDLLKDRFSGQLWEFSPMILTKSDTQRTRLRSAISAANAKAPLLCSPPTAIVRLKTLSV